MHESGSDQGVKEQRSRGQRSHRGEGERFQKRFFEQQALFCLDGFILRSMQRAEIDNLYSTTTTTIKPLLFGEGMLSALPSGSHETSLIIRGLWNGRYSMFIHNASYTSYIRRAEDGSRPHFVSRPAQKPGRSEGVRPPRRLTNTHF